MAVDVKQRIEEYLQQNGSRAKENANQSYSYPGLLGYLLGFMTSEYALNNIYPVEAQELHEKGHIHLHDMASVSLYCYGMDYEMALTQGIAGESEPPKHFETALGQMDTLIFQIAGQIAGAVAINSPDVLLAPYIKNDGLTYKQVKQNVQQFIYRINARLRQNYEAPFSNFQLDITVPKRLQGRNPMIAGQVMDFTYDDCQQEINWFDTALIEIMMESKKILPFPVLNMSITKDFNWDNKLAQTMFTGIGQMGLPVINNYVNSDYDPDSVKSMCCFDGSQEVFVRVPYKEDNYELPFDKVYEKFSVSELFTLSHGNIWEKCKVIRVKTGSHKLFKITTENHKAITVTDNHINVTQDWLKRTIDLTLNDYLVDDFDSTLTRIESIEEIVDKPEYVYCFTMEDQSDPYFTLANGIITHNCSLRLDMSKIMKSGGSFGSNDNSGSVGVVTINLALLGYLSKTEDELKTIIKDHMKVAEDVLNKKREFIESWHKLGMYPRLKQFVPDFHSFFSTIGIAGMNEMCLNHIGKGIDTPEGTQLSLRILEYMNNELSVIQRNSKDWYDGKGVYWNLELTPIEGATRRLAQQMHKYYPQALTSNGSNQDYITRGCWLPADTEYTLKFATEHQQVLQDKFSGGANFNYYLEAPIDDWKTVRSIVRKIVNNTTLPFISISPSVNICPVCGKRLPEGQLCEHDLSADDIEKYRQLNVEIINSDAHLM